MSIICNGAFIKRYTENKRAIFMVISITKKTENKHLCSSEKYFPQTKVRFEYLNFEKIL